MGSQRYAGKQSSSCVVKTWDKIQNCFLEKVVYPKKKSNYRKKSAPHPARLYANQECEYKQGMGSDFYQTREWRSLRHDVLSASDGCCAICGRSKKKHGVVIHVDHIKPRSKYPSLELVKSNLQVLCEDCNIGKGNK